MTMMMHDELMAKTRIESALSRFYLIDVLYRTVDFRALEFNELADCTLYFLQYLRHDVCSAGPSENVHLQ